MAKQSSFTLPAGVDLSVDDNKLNVQYDGDVTLEQSMGLELGSVTAGGDLSITLDRITGALKSGGTLTLQGEIDATSVEAPSLTLPGGASVRTIATDGDLTAGDLKAVDVSVGGKVEEAALDPSIIALNEGVKDARIKLAAAQAAAEENWAAISDELEQSVEALRDE